MSRAPILASKIHLKFMFFLEPFLDLLFLVFSNMMLQKVAFATPFKIHWGPKWRPKSDFSVEMAPCSLTRSSKSAFLEPTVAREAARIAADLIFYDFHAFRLQFSRMLGELLMNLGIASEHNFADR